MVSVLPLKILRAAFGWDVCAPPLRFSSVERARRAGPPRRGLQSLFPSLPFYNTSLAFSSRLLSDTVFARSAS